ncbi:MAG: ATP-binding protein [Agathobacter sp.]|nr:ATP-binding protein [Agathobacter sp.]
MRSYVNKDSRSFKSAIDSQIYVDKTGFLNYTNSVLNTEQRYICVSRPRRFGKSITAAMLSAYYSKGEDTRELFHNFIISASDDFMDKMNKFDVISLDMASMTGKAGGSEYVVQYLEENVLKELQEIYPQIEYDTKAPLSVNFAKIYNRTGAQFIVIIDEWDCLFREYPADVKAQNAYIDFLRDLFKSDESKSFIVLAYLTGILPIKKYNSESSLNNFDEFTMVNASPLEEYSGFTEEEVRQLCSKYQMDFNQIKRWYDGYILGDDTHIYNPKSVTDAIRRKRIANYWSGTVTYESLRDYISMNFDGLKDSIVQMLAGEPCPVKINTFQNDLSSFQNKDDVLTVLIHLGYLAYDDTTKTVRVPNEEIRQTLESAVLATNWTYVIRSIQQSDMLLKATWNMQSDVVAQMIDEVHSQNTSILNYNDENALSCVISLAYYNAVNEYTHIREFPTGKGFADIVFLPRKGSECPAMIIELKYDKSAKGAIQQIKDKKYVSALKEYHGNLLLVGINYDRKTKKHCCEIEKFEIV